MVFWQNLKNSFYWIHLENQSPMVLINLQNFTILWTLDKSNCPLLWYQKYETYKDGQLFQKSSYTQSLPFSCLKVYCRLHCTNVWEGFFQLNICSYFGLPQFLYNPQIFDVVNQRVLKPDYLKTLWTGWAMAPFDPRFKKCKTKTHFICCQYSLDFAFV